MNKQRNRIVVCLALAIVLLWSVGHQTGAAAPDQQVKPVEAYLAEVQQSADAGDLIGALNKISMAVGDHPLEPRIYETYGRVLISLQMWGAALERLDQAASLGADSVTFHMARAEALTGQGKPRAALDALKQAPQISTVLMMRSVLHLQLGAPQAALPLLDRALKQAPKQARQIRLFRAQALAMMNQGEQARQELRKGWKAGEEGAWLAGPYLRLNAAIDRLDAVPPAVAQADWGYRLSLGVGFNDNVVLLPDQASAPLASALSNEDDLFFSEQLQLWWRVAGDERSGLILQASVGGTHHAELQDYNQVYVSSGAMAVHRIDDWRLEGGIDLGYANVDTKDYSWSATGYAAVRRQINRWTQSNLSYQLSFRDFQFDTVPQEDRDGLGHLLRLTQDVFVPLNGRKAVISPMLEWGLDETDGASAQNQYWGIGTRLRVPLTDRLELLGGGGYRDYDYDNPHIRTGFATARRDEQWYASAALRYRLDQHTYFTCSWD